MQVWDPATAAETAVCSHRKPVYGKPVYDSSSSSSSSIKTMKTEKQEEEEERGRSSFLL